MSPRVAILYTGQVRTLTQTLFYLRKHLDNNDVFAVLQADGAEPKDIESHMRDVLQDSLKSLEWFDPNRAPWPSLSQHMLDTMPDVSDQWKHYLRTSGSMIEYYQLRLAILALQSYETANNFHYDTIVRMRTDVVLTRPFFDGMMGRSHMTPEVVEPVVEYTGTIATIRANLCYVGPRDAVVRLACLGVTYGQWRMPDNEWWFNAESQFQQCCAQHGIRVVNTCTALENKSVYDYQPDDFYSKDGHLLDDLDALVFIRR